MFTKKGKKRKKKEKKKCLQCNTFISPAKNEHLLNCSPDFWNFSRLLCVCVCVCNIPECSTWKEMNELRNKTKKTTHTSHIWSFILILCVNVLASFISVQLLSCVRLFVTPRIAGLPIHHQLLESTQTHVHLVSDTIQPSHPLSSPFPPTFNLSQQQCLFKWVSSSP